MTDSEIKSVLDKQRSFFESGATLSVDFRIAQLKKLYSAIKSHESQIAEALCRDLGKSRFESFMCETGLALSEISYMLRHIRRFAAEKTVPTPLSQFAARSFKVAVPYGNVLIMSPWNYPFLLTVSPLANAIAAGNTAVVKPSAYSPETSRLLFELIAETFSPEYVSVVTGGRAENSALLNQKFDMIFFTGSREVGKEVLRHAAERLTPAVLELGGKSPCIVDKTADIPLAAKRIVFGKFLNCGQTCVAPDYILCESTIEKQLLAEITKQIELQFGKEPLKNRDYGKIIGKKHFDRLCALIDKEKVVFGGETDADSCRIAPTVMLNVTENDAVMGQEIFGPILPIMTFDSFDELVSSLKKKEKPLALYLFSDDKGHIKRVSRELQFGGGCINDVVIHLATSEMGFGGVGESGMGSYHGKDGFDAFSHYKSIVDKKTLIDMPIRYQPYKSGFYDRLLRLFLK